ncbi:MAG: hemolysin family protein [Treponema sp.]
MLVLTGLIAACILLITLSMLFSISECSFLAMNKLRLRILRGKKDERALRVGKLLDQKETLINTLLAANDFVNILLSSLLTALSLKLFGSKGVGIATFTVTFLLLIFGEITPKTLSTRNPDAVAYRLSRFVSVVVALMRPAVVLLTAFSRFILRLLKIDTAKPVQSYTEEDIKQFIEAGWETGILERGEKNMMRRVFTFTDLEARDIMIPRTRMKALPDTCTYRDALERAQRTRFSYFPVYHENLDRIVGVLYLKDLLKYTGTCEQFDIKKAVRPPLFILGAKKISSVQELLRQNRQAAAIITDEYSGTAGFLTQDDLYTEIFGAEGSRTPSRNVQGLFEAQDFSDFTVDGSVLLSDLKEHAGIKLCSHLSETLGGWITERLGRLAKKGDAVEYEGFLFTVEAVHKKRIAKARVRSRSKTETET